MNARLNCPICGKTPKEYAPWYKASRGTLGGHFYNAHKEELRDRLCDPNDKIIAELRDNGFCVVRAAPGDLLPIKIKRCRVKR